ncbi:hypothetical protein JHK87_016175 [Glycine soja]|nr:hypothetical protein JHK87_016175 [Glycine soja]
MDISSSQYNSAGESGWTHYLDYSSLSESYFQMRGGIEDHGAKGARVEEEEEDLSMISDASSGPQHYHEDDGQHYCVNWMEMKILVVAFASAVERKTRSRGFWNNIREYKKLKRVSDSIFLDAIRDRHA